MSDADPLPRGWAITELGQLIEVLRGVTYKKADSRMAPEDGLLPLIRATNIDVDLNFDNLVYVPREVVKERQLLQRGDLVVAASSGSASVVGKAAPLTRNWIGTFGAFCFAIRPVSSSLAGYLAAYFRTTEYRQTASSLSAGVNINNLKRQHIEGLPLRVAPLAEQRRIVEALDSYLSRLDAAQAALERVQTNLARYRASVLQAAVEGRLVPTEAELARKQGRDYEPASVLLERILVERRERWEAAELAKMRAKGKEPKNDKWKARYKEPVAPDTSELPDLPEGWCWATTEQLAAPEPYSLAIGPFGSNLKVSDYTDSGVPLVFVRHIRSQRFRGLNDQFVSEEKAQELAAHSIAAGDVLITKMGDPPGDVATYPRASPAAIITADCIKLRLAADLRPGFVQTALRNSVVRRQIHAATKGVAQKKVSLARFRQIAIPVAPVSEQERLALDVAAQESLWSQQQTEMARARSRLGRLRQSILNWAFEGKLVDQDPNEEPASVLLDRIRAERQAATPKKRTRRKKKATA